MNECTYLPPAWVTQLLLLGVVPFCQSCHPPLCLAELPHQAGRVGNTGLGVRSPGPQTWLVHQFEGDHPAQASVPCILKREGWTPLEPALNICESQ